MKIPGHIGSVSIVGVAQKRKKVGFTLPFYLIFAERSAVKESVSEKLEVVNDKINTLNNLSNE